MKANAGKRKIFDAVDLLTEDTSAQVTEVKSGNGVEQIKIDDIQDSTTIRFICMRARDCRIWFRALRSMAF